MTDKFRLLVTIHERRIDVLRLAVNAGGKDVLHAVDEFELLRLLGDVLYICLAHPSEAVGGLTDVMEQQAEREILLLEKDSVAGDGFADTALDSIEGIVVDAEGFPDLRLHTQQGTRTCERVVLRYLIVSVIREERKVRATTSATQSARGREVHPEVGIRRQRDEERLHRIVVTNLVELLAVDVYVFTLRGFHFISNFVQLSRGQVGVKTEFYRSFVILCFVLPQARISFAPSFAGQGYRIASPAHTKRTTRPG